MTVARAKSAPSRAASSSTDRLASTGPGHGAAPAAAAIAPTVLTPVIVKGRRPNGYFVPDTATATGTDTPLIDIPQTIEVIPAKLLHDQAAQSLADAMRNAPGVSVQQGEGNRDEIVIRGVKEKSDFFVNGVPDDSERFRDLYNIAHVDVLQGPAAVLFGRGGQGGIVNLVTKQPTRDAIHRFTLQTGSHDHRRGTLDLGGPLGPSAAYRLNAMAEDSASFRDHFWLHRYGIDPEIGIRLGSDAQLEAGVEADYDHRLADRGIPSRNGRPANVPRSRFFGSIQQNHARVRYDAAHVRFSEDLGDHLSFRDALRFSHTDHFYQNLYPGSAVTPGDTLDIAGYRHLTVRNAYFNEAELVGHFDTGRIQHTLVAGLDLSYEHDHDAEVKAHTIPGVSIFDPIVEGVYDIPNRDNQVSAHAAGLYVEDQLSFGSHWKALLGVRYGRFSVVGHFGLLSAGSGVRATDKDFSPRAGLIWKPVPHDSLYASYSRTFTPQGSNVALSLKGPEGADLAPEKAANYEVGNKLDLLDGALSLQVAVFRLELYHLTASNPDDPTELVQTGRQRNEGAEVTLVGKLTKNWAVYADYTHLTDARLLDPTTDGPAGARAGLVPKNQFSIWTAYAIGKHWGIGGGVLGNSRQYTSFSDAVVLPGYARTDLMAFYQVRGYRIQLNFNNVFDRRYYPTANGDNQIMPGAPRTLFLSLRSCF